MHDIPDIFEEFMKHQSELDPETTVRRVPRRLRYYLQQNEGQTVSEDGSGALPFVPGRRQSQVFNPGTKVNFVEIVEREANGKGYLCRCIAPKRDRAGKPTGEICGRPMPHVKYSQLYRDAVFSCGCRLRAKHPPMRLEGATIGRLEVLRWAEEEASWECVCQECGAILYLATAKEVRGASVDCSTHRD